MLEADEVYMRNLFGDKYLFEIPNFQRPFSWRKENFEQLFDDLKDELQINQEKKGNKIRSYDPYFLGSIILCVKNLKPDGSGTYEIIDGQQRIVSLAILMAVLRDSANRPKAKMNLQRRIYQEKDEYSGTEESVRVKVRDKEKDFFRKYVLDKGGTDKATRINRTALSEPQNHMIEAINAFQKGFERDDGGIDGGFLDNYIKYLLQKVVIVVVKTDSLPSAFRLFNVINARGMPLTNADLLKSENLRVIAQEKREQYTQTWENIEEDIGTDNLEMLISFIRHIKKKEKARRAIFEEFAKDIFKREPGFKGESFIQYLDQIATIYKDNILEAKVRGLEDEKETYYYNLVSLMRDFLPFNDWMAALIKFKEKHGAMSLIEFLNKMEKKVAVDWITGLSFTERLTQVYRIIRSIEKIENLKDVLNDAMFEEEIQLKKTSFSNSLDDVKFYGRGTTRVPKYVLLRLDMERKDNLNARITYSGYITVEHILPRKPYEKYWLDKFDKIARMEWTNRLGNLVLLNGRKNSQASNKPFDRKVKDYFEKKSDFEITNELKKVKDWNLTALKERHENLKKECVELWIGE